jgi:hypothetical protein
VNEQPPKWKEKGTDKPNKQALDELREGTDMEKKGNSFLNFFNNCNRTQKRKITFLSNKQAKKFEREVRGELSRTPGFKAAAAKELESWKSFRAYIRVKREGGEKII